MIADINITEKSFGPKTLFSKIKFSVSDGEKIGLVGRNGIGKTTLFNILTGKDKDFTGDIIFSRGISVVASSQEHHNIGDKTVIEYILSGLPEYAKLHEIITTYPDKMGENIRLINEYSDALERFGQKGFYTIEDDVKVELDNFQLANKSDLAFASLSGGQKRLVEIIKIMHSNAHLALIDEPTNHMDYVAKKQFVDWMKNYKGAVVVITHDRDVLEQVDKIVEIKDGGSQIFKGSYDDYLRQNAQTTSVAMNDFEVIEKRIVNLKAKVLNYQRMKEKARDGGTIQRFKRLENQSRKELAELEEIKKPTFWIDKNSAENLNYKVSEQYDKFKAKNIRMNIKSKESRSSHILIKVNNLSIGYDEPLFSNINIDLREGEVAEIRGRNGAGKSSLIKAILDKKPEGLVILDGEIQLDHQVRVGIYEQEISEKYFNLTLADAIEQIYVDKKLNITPTKVRQLMSDYLFNEGDIEIPVERLSGGQKARLQMISMLANDPQLLILDEPTNHLDLPSIEELETALKKYQGAILYVSHDSYFRDVLGGEVINLDKSK